MSFIHFTKISLSVIFPMIIHFKFKISSFPYVAFQIEEI